MAAYKPALPFNVSMMLLVPTTTRVQGVAKKAFPKPEEGLPFNGSFRTFGGTERITNDVYTIEATATIDTWYRPDITSDCHIYICQTGQTYEIISEPENIDMRNQYMQFRVRKVGGRA